MGRAMTNRSRIRPRPGLGSILALSLLVACAAPETEPVEQAVSEQPLWTPTALSPADEELPDPGALVRRMSDFLGKQTQLAMEAVVTYQAVQESGQKLHFVMLQRMAIQKPDRLFWMSLHDDATTESGWLAEGRFTLLKQPSNLWGRIAVPTQVPEAIERLVGEYDLEVPFSEIVTSPAGSWLDDGATAEYIGEAWAQGTWTDHVAIRKPGVDLEIWIRKGDEPFPARMAVVYTEEEALPSYYASFREFTTTLSAEAIPEFSPPEGSERVEVVPLVQP